MKLRPLPPSLACRPSHLVVPAKTASLALRPRPTLALRRSGPLALLRRLKAAERRGKLCCFVLRNSTVSEAAGRTSHQPLAAIVTLLTPLTPADVHTRTHWCLPSLCVVEPQVQVELTEHIHSFLHPSIDHFSL